MPRLFQIWPNRYRSGHFDRKVLAYGLSVGLMISGTGGIAGQFLGASVGLGIWEMGCTVGRLAIWQFCPVLPDLKIGAYFSI